MGKPTGFLEIERREPEARAPGTRIADFAEFAGTLPEPELAGQAARCMDCGVPFCSAGGREGARVAGCPLHNLVPEWNDLVFRGRWREALDRLHLTNDFPEFTGRVCPAPCESACVLALDQRAVAIKTIECAIVDRGFAEGWVVPQPPAARSGRSVAIVGSGPAGLACANQLNRRGHLVTVYERSERLGGLLTYGVPAMKLAKGVVQRRVDLLAAEGVRFVTNAAVGPALPGARLRAEHDAVVLAVGAGRPRPLAVPGADLTGVVWAMDYLTEAVRALVDGSRAIEPSLDARGKQVVVIGGGDTGTDCVATALRHGAAAVTQLQHNPQPPESRAADNPWPQWPRVHRVEYGHEEAAALFGADPRSFAERTAAITGESGRAAAVVTDHRTIPADLVLLAMGFSGPDPALAQELGLALSPGGTIAATDHATSSPGIFTAGDCRRGQRLVVWAIREGRDAAAAVDRYLARR